MSGILPNNGVPPGSTTNGAADANLAPGCENLYYAARCNPKFDPFAMNALISEIIHALNYMGRPYDCEVTDNVGMMLLALAAGQMTYNVTTGSANDRAVDLPPLFNKIGLLPGMEVKIRSHVANTGAMTLNVDGLGVRSIVSANGSALSGGSFGAGEVVSIIYDGANWVAHTKTVSDTWSNRLGVGAVYTVDTSLTGVDIPPSALNASGVAFIQLTTGLMGANQYNQNKLDNEQVSGSFPENIARARISLPSSPMYGQFVHLLNTEGRVLRPSSAPGIAVADAFQAHSHAADGDPSARVWRYVGQNAGNMDPVTGGPSVEYVFGNLNDALSIGGPISVPGITVRSDSETRMKNLGVTAYMRIR